MDKTDPNDAMETAKTEIELGSLDDQVLARAVTLGWAPWGQGTKETVSITAQAANKLNIGDYSSADRGVFLKREIEINSDKSEQEKFAIIVMETKKLQMIAELQLAAITAEAMNRDNLNNAGWSNIFNGIWKRTKAITERLFGIEPEPKS